MADWLDNIARMVRDELGASQRVGFYLGRITNALQSLRRVDVQPEWLDGESESLERLLRIAPSILDVIEAVGTRVAVLSQDGLPEAGAVIGAVTDDVQDGSARTVWIRCDLEQHAGHIEIGTTKGVRVFVGTNPGDLTPVSDDDIEIECPGEIRLGAAASDWIALSSLVETELAALWTALETHSHVTTATVDGGPVAVVSPPGALGSAGDVSSSKTKSE